MTHFPKLRRQIRASAIATPCLFFSAFLLFARGMVIWSAIAVVLALVLLLAFPHFIDFRQSLQPAPETPVNDRSEWVRWTAKYGMFFWVISQPEFTAFQNRVFHGGAFWDGWLIAPVAVLTGYSIYAGLKRVPLITDAAIYAYFTSSPLGEKEKVPKP